MSAAPTLDEGDVLIATDVQVDFCPGGALAVPDGDAVVPVINRLGRTFPHVLVTQDWHPPGHVSFASAHEGKEPNDTIETEYGEQVLWPDHCVRATEGAELHPDLELPTAELIIRKGYHHGLDSYSVFFENDRATPTGLGGYLRERGLRRLFFAGLATDFCVLYSALDGVRLGFEVFVIEDACRGIDLDGSLAAALEQMDEAGVRRIASADIGGAA
ncbi:MAG: bifunctional nicotinamidase/pyrazinamidase [Planctomycetota bacterium]